MKVGDWLRTVPSAGVTVREDAGVHEATDLLLSHPGLRDLYVVDESGKLVGHLGFGQLAQLLLAEHRPVPTRRELMHRVAGGTIREVMDARFHTARPDEHLTDVLARQLEDGIEDLAVVDDGGSLRGTVSLSEVLRAVRRGELDGDLGR